MKKRKIFLVIIILLLFIGGVFWWKNREIKGNPEDYALLGTPEGRIVENKRAGLKVKVPEKWIVEKVGIEEGSIVFYSPEAEGMPPGEIRPPLKSGCLCEIAVGYEKRNFDNIKKEIEGLHRSLAMKYDTFEITEINGGPALKNTFDCVDLGPATAIYILNENKFYSFTIISAYKDINKCSQEFEEILETISIE